MEGNVSECCSVALSLVMLRSKAFVFYFFLGDFCFKYVLLM